jgi:ParB family chromosome partitioning protein
MSTLGTPTHSSQIIEVPIDKIKVGERFRKEHGNIYALQESIEKEGLMQPIGITPDFELVFGERRLLACQYLLWDKIPARIVLVSSIIAGEYAENEIRKDFTPSERAAIADTIEAQMCKRQGNPALMHKKYQQNPIQDNCPELKGKQTREIAAERAGFGSYKAYERASKVVEDGIDELRAEMDSGNIAVSTAAVIATQPAERQREIIQMPPAVQREAVRELRQPVKNSRLEARKKSFFWLLDEMQDLHSTPDELADFINSFGEFDLAYVEKLHSVKRLLSNLISRLERAA